MKLSLDILQPQQWNELSKNAHLAVFHEEREPSMNRIDYAMLVHNEKEPCCYATIIELDAQSAYMQHGGAFPSVAKGVFTVKGYMTIVNQLKTKYKKISTKIHTKNNSMLRMALAAGLEVTGLDVVDGVDIFLILSWDKAAQSNEQA